MARTLVLAGSLALIALLGALTVTVAINDGVSVLVIVSAGILLLLGFGLFGALTAGPPDE